MKKYCWCWMAVCLLLMACPAKVFADNSSDPKILSVEITKKYIRPGQTQKIRVKLTQSAKVKSVSAYYWTPLTGNSMEIKLSKQKTEGLWEGKHKAGKGAHNGTYRLNAIFVTTDDKDIELFNSKASPEYDTEEENLRQNLNHCNFKIRGGTNDLESPVLDAASLKVSRKRVRVGEKVTFTIRCSDPSGITDAWLTLIRRMGPDSLDSAVTRDVQLKYNKKKGLCRGSYTFRKKDRKGIWKVLEVNVFDKYGNSASCGNSRFQKTMEGLTDFLEDWSDRNIVLAG